MTTIPPEDHAERVFRYASPDQLRIGMYVHVDLPWFLHPFTRSHFRIASEEQIAELRALGLRRIRCHSEHVNEYLRGELPAAAKPAAPAAEVPPANYAQADPVITVQEERLLRLREQRQIVTQTEKAFIKAAGIVRTATRNLLLRPEESMEELNGLLDQMASVFLEREDVSLRVMSEKCGGEEAYFHGLNVSVLSMMLARGLNITGEQARSLAAGALLHDIGQIDIPSRVLKKDPREFTRPERELYCSHVENGLRIGKTLGLDAEVLAIIAQHHEMADGSGFPHALRLEHITPLARVVALVNLYDNLCNPVISNQAMTPHEALSFIFVRRRDRFEERVLQFMIRSLGVYPPGSIVKLTNNAIAMVVSVNPQNALRPWVMLYDAGVPRHEAVMLDLEHETELGIAKSLRPSTLPPAVYAYLSPRKRITYFFDSDLLSPAERI